MNSGTATFNTTLNLTGHILLGLGIASGLLAYMFIQALNGLGGEEEAADTGYGGGGDDGISSIRGSHVAAKEKKATSG